ncbi:MAG: (d)CMP kinase [Patescibacteria group bacterium]|jgi:cytidylate kinase|nr:cytidylate kinase family protein [bacterium]HQC49942.1 cytidylate kinase family protein [bacterium]
MIISFSGAQGSGKSTIAERLAKKLGWPRYYVGGLRREAAKKRGLTLSEYNKLGETDPETDLEVDKYQEKLGKEQDNFIIEGRTSWYFIPHSFKIYLDVEKEVGAKRIFGHLQQKNDRNEDVNLKSWEDVLASNEKRLESDRLRYQKYYQIDVNDLKHYDFYLDTTKFNQDEVFAQVWEAVKEKLGLK